MTSICSGASGSTFGGGDVAQDGLEQRLQVGPQLGGQPGLAGDGVGVDHREIGLLVAGAQLDEQVKGLVEHALRVGVLAVHLVDHHDGPVAHLQRLLQHKARLRHGAFGGIHQQQHAIHHVHHPLHLAAEIGVAGGVDDVDLDLLLGQRRPRCVMAVFLARMVMPRSRSRSLESITRSATCWLSRKTCACRSRPSTRVVLPWSTWAMMAMLRKSVRSFSISYFFL